jgi:hypothetical protein
VTPQEQPDFPRAEDDVANLELRASLAFDDLSSAVQTQFRMLLRDVAALSPALAERLLSTALDIADEVSVGTIQYSVRHQTIWCWPEPKAEPDGLEHELWVETRRKSERRALN